jgi:hypothetical protein
MQINIAIIMRLLKNSPKEMNLPPPCCVVCEEEAGGLFDVGFLIVFA